MTFQRLIVAGATALLVLAGPLMAQDITVKDPYARTSTPSSVTGAAFLVLVNSGEADDRLIAAATDVATRVELHTHREDANGVMRMMEVEGGIIVPAGGMHALERGGDHIMMMGLTRPLEQGEEIAVTLTFERAGEIEVMVPVDRERRPSHGGTGHLSDG